MSGPMFNALCLLAAAVLVTCFFLRRRSPRDATKTPHLPEGADLREFLRARYAAKTRFRAGVLLCSLAALAVYFGGGGRVIPLLLLCGAALCQYGAVRQKTSAYLSRALQQRFMTTDEPEVPPSEASAGRRQEHVPTHATTRR